MSGDEDTEVFEITDFTTASEWERFIARFEEILHEWKLVSTRTRRPVTKEEQLNGVWVEKKENLSFSDFQFVLSHHYLKPAIDETMETKDNVDEDNDEDEEKEDVIPLVMMDLMNTENDFPAKAHNLCRVYGLHDFVVLAPSTNSDAIDSESRIKLLLSSVSIGLNNTRCITPVFIHIKEHWRQMYTGVCMPPGALVEFDVLHLNKTPSQYNHLAGLLDVFKAKLCTHVSPRPTVNVAVRFTFFLQDWVNSPWPQEPPDFSSVMEDKVGVSSIGCLPFGATEDPVSELRLACTWPSLSEDMIVENQNYSDLDPLQAPQWSVKINMSEDPSCLLGEYLRSFVKHGNRRESAEDLLFNMVALNDDDEQTDITQALSRLTEPKVPYSLPSLSHVKVRSGRRVSVKNGDSPLSPDVLKKVLEFLFPDAKDPINKARELYTAEDEKDEDVTESDPPKDNRYTDILKDLSKQMKSAPVDSIVHKLAVCLCMVNMAHGGLRGVAQLWQEFVLEMRYRLENNFFIKGVQPGSPNLGSCLLYQKLQMLNCCIERKIKRDQLFKGYTGEKEYSRSDEDVEESDLGQNDHLQEKRQKFAEKTRFSQSLDSKRVVKKKNSNTSTSKSKSSECLSSSSSSSKISNKVDNSLTSKKDKSQTSGSSAKKDSQQSCDSTDTVGAQKGKISQKGEKASEGETECQTEKSLKRGDKSWKSLDVCSSSEDEFFECDDSIDVENDDKGSDERDDGDEDGDSDMEDEDKDIECITEDMDSKDGDKADDEEDEVIEISDEDSKEESEGEENKVHDDDDEEEDEDEDDSPDEQESTTLEGEKDATEDSSQESMETSFHESLSHRPEGRLAPFNDEKLLETGEQMYIPMTQEPAPMTEDMLEEHAEILAKLGTSSEGAQIRARMQSACLVSDMESFKAANPGCTLEDFVRWYSPRDWVEEETVDDNGQTVKGHLSQRMMIPGNIWVDAWQGAKPVPARRQKRLFDDTKEAEKVLHFLSSMKPAHLVLNVMPSLIHAAIIKVVDNEDQDIPHLKDAIDQLVRKAAKLTRSMPQNIKKFEDLVQLITLAETMIARAKSLKDKFSKDLLDQKNAEKELEQFVADLLHHQEVVVRGGPYGPAGSIIHKLFVAAQKEINMVMGDEGEEDSNSSTISDFPKPTGREYILRTFAPRPAPYSKSLPQRMYCNITEGHEFRLAGAFASDTVFQ